MRHIQDLVYYLKLRHIQAYCGIFRTLCNSCSLAFSEPYHIQNPGIFWSWDIFRTLSRHILGYSECCVTLTYGEPCHIQSFSLFRILAYLGLKTFSESCLFRHMQAYSDIFNNDSYNIKLIFFSLYFYKRLD